MMWNIEKKKFRDNLHNLIDWPLTASKSGS